MALLSQAEYARQKGVTRQAVNDLVARGVLPLVAGKVDTVVADAVFAERLDPARSKILNNRPPAPVVAPLAGGADAEPAAGVGITSYHVARTMKENYAALNEKLEYKVRAGELVEIAIADRQIVKFFDDLATRLDNIPDRIAAEFGVDDDHRSRLRTRLAEEINRIRNETIDAYDARLHA